MSEFKGVSTDKLQAQYDAAVDSIRVQQEKLAPIAEELSRRSNARTLIINQVIAGQSDALRAVGVSEEAIADAEAHVANTKARKAERRKAAIATPVSAVEGGAS